MIFIGLGSNLGDRLANLEAAAVRLQGISSGVIQVSPVFETRPLLPPEAPPAWNIPFLNAVITLQCDLAPPDLLQRLKAIEAELGRLEAPHWAPRVIDLDLLADGGLTMQEPACFVPHPGLADRAFVLAPLKHLAASMTPPGFTGTVLARSRQLAEQLPLWCGVFNFTPDSFSDGGQLDIKSDFVQRVEEYERNFIQMFDLGGQSTRPGAAPVREAEEWDRLRLPLEYLSDRYARRFFKPWISVDTFHTSTAAKALAYGATLINDVSGMADPAMLDLLRGSTCQYVLMHSLGVPADPKRTLAAECDPVVEIRRWALDRLEQFEKSGIALDRIVFDPGIGFGKTAAQSIEILRRIDEFMDLPVRLMVGHSRKSFMNLWGRKEAGERDAASIGISLRLAARGADILRVHEAALHAQAYGAFVEAG